MSTALACIAEADWLSWLVSTCELIPSQQQEIEQLRNQLT